MRMFDGYVKELKKVNELQVELYRMAKYLTNSHNHLNTKLKYKKMVLIWGNGNSKARFEIINFYKDFVKCRVISPNSLKEDGEYKNINITELARTDEYEMIETDIDNEKNNQ